MEMNGVPGKNTVGKLGDVCVNLNTNDKYKCVCIYEIKVDDKIRYEYQWELMGSMGNANSVNGYSIWVGTTEELNALTSRDSNTLYFETGDE